MTKPRWTFWLALSVVVVYLFPPLSRCLLYDREAILSGQFWRLATGHLVHFSPTHLIYDLLALGLAAGILARTGDRRLGPTLLIATLAISFALLTLAPEIQFYGGLSGLATAALVVLGLQGLQHRGIWRAAGGLLLAGFLIKLTVEIHAGVSVFARFDGQIVKSCPLAHAAGGLAALLTWLFIGDSRRPSFVIRYQ